MATSGLVTKITTDPRGCNIGGPPGVSFTPLTDDQWTVIREAQRDKEPVTVQGTPPNCTGVSRP